MDKKLSVREVAAESGMCVGWWRKKIALKEVPYYKVGRRVLIDRGEIDALFERSRVEAKGQHG